MKFWEDSLLLLEQFIFGESIWRIAGAVGIIILTTLLRQLFTRFIVELLKKLTKRTKNDIDDKMIDALEKPAKFAITVLGFYLAAQVIEFSIEVQLFIGKVTRSLILYTIFWAAYRMASTVTHIFKKITEKTKTHFDDMLTSFLVKGLKVMIITLGSITIIQVWFNEIAGILTGLGLGGLAFALAAQETAANLFGGITIMVDRPFEIGDWIETPHVQGIVEEMGFRSTRVRTFGQALVTVPNSVMGKDTITNWSKMGKRRISYNLPVTYNATPQQMRECINRLREMLESHPEVHPDTICVFFEKFGENGLEIMLYFFTKTTRWLKHMEVKEDINLKVMEIMDECGIRVALPSRNIYIASGNEESKPGIIKK